MPTLLEIVTDLEPRLRQALAAIQVTWSPDGTTAACSISLFTRSTRRVDTDNLPAGVGVTGFERWPDVMRPVEQGIPLDAQIAELDASGIVGRLDHHCFVRETAAVRAGYEPLAWIIKTHAGSNAERVAWVRSLRPGGREVRG